MDGQRTARYDNSSLEPTAKTFYYFIKYDDMAFLYLVKVVRDVLRINAIFEPGSVKRNLGRSI